MSDNERDNLADNLMDVFSEKLAHIDRLGHCRRLVFTVRDRGYRSVVAKIIVSDEIMMAIAQMILADANVPSTKVLPFAARLQ